MGYILGISAGRKNKISESAVKYVLDKCEMDYDFYSLSSFDISTCDACNGCVESYRCVKEDKVNEIIDKMEQADGIVFGAPEYWDGINAKGRAFWERVCFSTRHNANFSFKGMKGIAVGVSGDGDSSGVIKDIKTFYDDARINIIEDIEIQGEYACFTCGYGDRCFVGGLDKLYDLPKEITDQDIPDLCNQHPETGNGHTVLLRLKEAAVKLQNAIKR